MGPGIFRQRNTRSHRFAIIGIRHTIGNQSAVYLQIGITGTHFIGRRSGHSFFTDHGVEEIPDIGSSLNQKFKCHLGGKIEIRKRRNLKVVGPDSIRFGEGYGLIDRTRSGLGCKPSII